MKPFANIHKIAVLRATALGDFIASTPALKSLRAAYPNAEIVYLGTPLHKALFHARSSPIDRVIVVPICYGIREPAPYNNEVCVSDSELDEFFSQMQQEEFDLAIQMHGGGRNSNPFLRRLGAKHCVGMATPDAPKLERWMPYIFLQNEFFRLLELAELAGGRADGYLPEFPVIAQDYKVVQQELPELKKSYVVLHTGASDPRRRWQAEHFAEVADALYQKDYQIVLTGLDYERKAINQVKHTMTYPVIDACSRLSIHGLIGLLANAALVISNDTGPMHLASAMGTPTIAIFWGLNYPKWSHPHRQTHRPLVSWISECPLCGLDIAREVPEETACSHLVSFVSKVRVDEVLYHAEDLLALTPTISCITYP
jgi:ADP-heptose:LPS heptosyltransferase